MEMLIVTCLDLILIGKNTLRIYLNDRIFIYLFILL